MANKAEEWVGKMIWMSKVNGQVEVNSDGWCGAYRKTECGACSRSVVARRV